MSSTIVSARSLFFQKEFHEDLIEVKSIFLFASLRTETSGLLRLRLLIPNGGYCFTMVVTALRLRLFILNTDSSFLYIFHFGKRETFGSEISPGPWYKKKSQFPIMMSNGGRGDSSGNTKHCVGLLILSTNLFVIRYT